MNKITKLFKNKGDESTIHWKHYPINGSLCLTAEILATYISMFWDEAFKFRDNSDKHLLLMLHVKFESKDLMTKSIGQMRRVNFEDKGQYINYIQNYLGILTEIYKDAPIETLSFNYIIQNGQATGDNRFELPVFDAKVHSHRIKNMDLPLTMKTSEFGEIIGVDIKDDHTRFIVLMGTKTVTIDRYPGGVNKCKILVNNTEWTDTKTDFGFIRVVGNTSYYVENGEIVLKKNTIKLQPFQGHAKEKTLSRNIMTMDVETILNGQGGHIPYCVNLFNGKEHLTEYSTSPKDHYRSLLIDLF